MSRSQTDVRRRQRSQSVSSREEDGEDGARALLLRLLEDYPTPLTRRQRQLFFRHVSFHVRRYRVILRATLTVRRGWETLHSVMSELRAEQATLEAALQATKEGRVVTADDAPPPQPAAALPSSSETPSESARPRRLLFGGARGGRGGGVFAHLQSVLQSAQKEEEQKYGDVRHARERIAKETRLKMVQEDLALHEQYFAPLEERRLKCEALETDCRENSVVPLLALQQALYEQEGRYAAAFSLRVTGHVAVGSMFAPDDACGEDDADAAAEKTGAATCDMYCAPATYTEEVLDVIRSQVEDVLDDYLTYRARMDPVLSRLEQEQAAREAQRLGQLMNVMGLADGTTVGEGGGILSGSVLGTGSAEGSGVDGGVLGVAPAQKSRPVPKPVRAGLGISDDDEVDDVDELDMLEDTVGLDDGADDASGAEAKKKKERAQIQSALSVLDDFESLF